MFSVSRREQGVLLLIVAAMLAGVAVKHWRDACREQPTPVLTVANPAPPR